jgi:penicillin amidase
VLRRIGWFALGVLALLAVGLLGLLLWLRSAAPKLAGEITLPGLHANVEVWRDALGIPHIFAADAHDLHFAQGFLHAQDRLWQMELLRRVTQGRLAEALGPDLVESDRFLRTLGLWRAAGDQEAAMAPDALATLEAYAAGVNAFLQSKRGALPPEFLALGIEPEPWTVRHSLSIEKIMAWDLALYGDAAEATRALNRLGPDTIAALLTNYPEWAPTIAETAAPPLIPGPASALLDALSTTRASNAWVIGGNLTRSGRPILANDMHLAMRAPSLWYLAAHHGGAYQVAGMTLPGQPYVVAGHTRAVAWGFTNASLDDIDFFRIRADSTDASRYITVAGSERFRVAAETIHVKGGDPVALNVRLTRFGPVVSLSDDGGDELVALRWAAHDPSRSYEAFPVFNTARSAHELLAAIPLFDNPHQNVVFADTAGTFGYAMGGRIPRRGNGKLPPTLPVPGWTGEWDWTGYLPFEEAHPVVLNPHQGYVVTANNRQVAGDMAAHISGKWEPPFRAIRISEMIRTGAPFDADAVHQMQLDVRDTQAERYRHRAVAAARAAGKEEAAAALEHWDLEARADSHGAALFYVWYERLRAHLRADLYGEEAGWLPRDAVDATLEAGTLPWHDGQDGQVVFEHAARAAFIEADSISAGRTWGELHHAVAEHALGASASLERILRLNLGPEAASGSANTVAVSLYTGTSFPTRRTTGVSQRHVVDMGNVDGTGGFILSTGQSGLPFDEHYRDQWRRWQDGGLWPIPLDRDRAVAGGVHRLLLVPAAAPGS